MCTVSCKVYTGHPVHVRSNSVANTVLIHKKATFFFKLTVKSFALTIQPVVYWLVSVSKVLSYKQYFNCIFLFYLHGTVQTLGNLSTDVFEPRTSTGSYIFPSLERFDAITFVTSNRRHKNKSFPVHGKEQNHAKKENFRLPVAVRGSKTSVLKFPNVERSL